MKRYLYLWLLAVALCPSSVCAEGGRISSQFMPTCTDGAPWSVYVVDATDDSDCDTTPSGTAEAQCRCLDGVIAAVTSGSGGAPATLDYFVGTATGSLSAERVGTDTASIDVDLGTAGQVKFNVITPVASASDLTCTNCIGGTEIDESALGAVPTATALAANPGDCSGAANQFSWRINSTGDLSCSAVDFSEQAPYSQYDPSNPPASVGTGGWNEDWTGDTAAVSWTWMNQDAATETISYDSSLITGEATADEIRGRFAAAATNADQTLTAKLISAPYPAGTNMACLLMEISAGTVASPTAIEIAEYGDFAPDGLYFIGDTDINPSAGWTAHGSGVTTWSIIYYVITPHYLQLRYIDSTRALSMWFSWDGIDWFQVGTSVTIAADPLFWGFGARDTAICRFFWVHLRTGSDLNDAGE